MVCALCYLLDVKIGNADPANLALVLELSHRLPAFGHFRSVFDGPMNLEEVNSFDPQPAQTIFALASNGVCLQHVVNLPLFIPPQCAFGENLRPLARPRLQCPGDNFL